MGKGNLYLFNRKLVANSSKPLLVEQMIKQAVLNKNTCIYITGWLKKSSFYNLGILTSKVKLVEMKLVINFE